MTQKTDDTFKMLYVLAILMIVDGHIGNYDYLNFDNLLRYQNYHIALFMFTSGYFLNLTYTYKEFITKKLTRLIIPLYIWNFIYGLICFILNKYADFKIGAEFNLYNLLCAPLTDGHQFIYNMASWFLVPLFFIQIISFIILKPYADKNGECKKPIYIIFFILALMLGIFALHIGPENQGNRNFTLMILRILYFLPSFSFGLIYNHLLKKYDTMNTPLYILIILSLTAVLCHQFPGYNHIPSWLDYVAAPSFVIYTISFLAILFWLRVAKILSPLMKQSLVLSYISNHTFDIMMHHFIGFMLIKATLSPLSGFNMTAYKTDIWYYYFPGSENLTAWLYIYITLVIALLTGFTSRKISDILRRVVSINTHTSLERNLL